MPSAQHEALLLPGLKSVALHVARARTPREVYRAIEASFRTRGVNVKALVPDVDSRELREVDLEGGESPLSTPALSSMYGRLVEERQLVFVEDMRCLVPDGSWGRGSGVVLPITVEHRIEVVLGFVSRSLRRSDVSLLQAVAALARLALARIGAESRLEETLREVNATHERLLALQRLEPIGAASLGVLHDVNNLLSVVVGWSHELETSAPSGELEQIWRACESMRSVTQAVLSLGHPTAMVPASLNFSSAISDLRPLLVALVGPRVQLRLELASMLPPVRMAISHFRQILLNLVHNARDAMPQGGKLQVATERRSLPGGRERAVLAVTDSGSGIGEVTRERIFEPFFTTKGPAAGSGLGLYVVSLLARQYGAEVKVENGAQSGVRFELSFAIRRPS